MNIVETTFVKQEIEDDDSDWKEGEVEEEDEDDDDVEEGTSSPDIRKRKKQKVGNHQFLNNQNSPLPSEYVHFVPREYIPEEIVTSPETKVVKIKIKPPSCNKMEALSPSPETKSLLSLTSTQTTNLFSSKAELSQEEIAARAAKDAEILQKVNDLQRDGLWSLKKMSKINEPPKEKCHWDYLLAEMAWLANDFKEERKRKQTAFRKLAKQAAKHYKEEQNKEERRAKEEEVQLKKVAKGIATEVKRFWSQIEKLVQFKQKLKMDEEKKKVMDRHLDFLVGQTEKYTEMLAQDLAGTAKKSDSKESDGQMTSPSEVKENHAVESGKDVQESMETESSTVASEGKQETSEGVGLKTLLEQSIEEAEDQEFAYSSAGSDDETTLDQEENENKEKVENEVDTLQKESALPLDELLKQYQPSAEPKEASQDMDVEEKEYEDETDDEEKEQDSITGKERISEAASVAKEAQPTGFTLSTTRVKTKVPFLIRGTLREYQHIGLDWLVTMYEKKLNVILADEMGLGKTIMTISLLAHLACEKEIWGPHLIVVPTSVMLNWELELKRWCPAFKILTYWGSQKERKLKRQGWSKPNSFHVCITSYKLVLQDHAMFRRKKWKYLILDEAQHIKNFKSQRWQSLLNFNSQRRLLLTGTPLQNSLMELWSLMHFLMPQVFQSHKEFKDWFANPMNSMIEGEQDVNEDLINRLHGILRPFLLRRLKTEVEKQLPGKYDHIVPCKLSKRQRYLYEEFMQSAGTQKTLASGNFLGIVNVLMQLRKVCNHPDLFEVRPIISPFDQEGIVYRTASLACRCLDYDPLNDSQLAFFNLIFDETMDSLQAARIRELKAPKKLIEELGDAPEPFPTSKHASLNEFNSSLVNKRNAFKKEAKQHMSYVNEWRCGSRPLYGRDVISSLQIKDPTRNVHLFSSNPRHYMDYSNALADAIKLPSRRAEEMRELIECFTCIIPAARAPPIELHCSHPNPSTVLEERRFNAELERNISPTVDIFRPSFVRMQLNFPDKRLIQFDCGKLQQLDILLRRLKSGGHKALIFTQMTRMLDILEIFLNIHGHTYLRLDGSTRVDRRQMLMEKFNNDPKIFLFILSTRSGGIGINLTGADTVIFYDSDWNPAMDAQAQDRCHRIGQTREVHIYRLISQHTIEENILKKANQKRQLDEMVISQGEFTTDFFKKLDIRELFEGQDKAPIQSMKPISSDKGEFQMSEQDWVKAVSAVEEESDVQAMEIAKREEREQLEDFTEDAATQEEKKDENDEDMVEQLKTSSVDENSFESQLTPIQRFALKFVEVTNPAMVMPSKSEELDLPEPSTDWNADSIQKFKEEADKRHEAGYKKRSRKKTQPKNEQTPSAEPQTPNANNNSAEGEALQSPSPQTQSGEVEGKQRARTGRRKGKRKAGSDEESDLYDPYGDDDPSKKGRNSTDSIKTRSQTRPVDSDAYTAMKLRRIKRNRFLEDDSDSEYNMSWLDEDDPNQLG